MKHWRKFRLFQTSPPWSLSVLHPPQSPLFLDIKHPRSPTCRIAYNQNRVNQYLPPITRSIFRGLRHNLSQHPSPPINCLGSFHHPSSFSLSYRLSFLGYLFPLRSVTRSITLRTQGAPPPPSSSPLFSDFMFLQDTFVLIICAHQRPALGMYASTAPLSFQPLIRRPLPSITPASDLAGTPEGSTDAPGLYARWWS